jgi:hypothetical protein
MDTTLTKYPKTSAFVSQLEKPIDTFLHDYSSDDSYGFWPDFEYFLANLDQFVNSHSILKKLSITAPMSMEIGQAWNRWQIFRAAQAEVTTVFLIEKAFNGKVLEIVPEGKVPAPDLKVNLGNQELLIEVKSQSGQQHGDKHPRSHDWIMFDPQDESDLKSWLFIERTSSRSGRPMKPKAAEAEGKKAHILAALTDFFTSMDDISRQASFICPGCELVDTMTIQFLAGKPLTVHFFKGEFPLFPQPDNLREIWLFDESHLDRFIVLSQTMYLLEHLKNRDNQRLHKDRSFPRSL